MVIGAVVIVEWAFNADVDIDSYNMDEYTQPAVEQVCGVSVCV